MAKLRRYRGAITSVPENVELEPEPEPESEPEPALNGRTDIIREALASTPTRARPASPEAIRHFLAKDLRSPDDAELHA